MYDDGDGDGGVGNGGANSVHHCNNDGEDCGGDDDDGEDCDDVYNAHRLESGGGDDDDDEGCDGAYSVHRLENDGGDAMTGRFQRLLSGLDACGIYRFHRSVRNGLNDGVCANVVRSGDDDGEGNGNGENVNDVPLVRQSLAEGADTETSNGGCPHRMECQARPKPRPTRQHQ